MQKQTPWNPGRLMQVSGAYWQGCALQAAVRLDLLTCLSGGPLDVDAIAGKTGADKDGVTRLLEAMVAMGLVEKRQGLYANGQAAERWLVKDSPDYMGYMILHHYQLLQSWCLLDKAVTEGRPQGPDLDFDDPQWRENFLMGMFNIGMQTAPLVAGTLELDGRRRLLDLGGGPGTYAIFFCKENKGLEADVFDLPTTESFARRTIERFGMQARIGFVAGDYTSQDLPAGYDVVWISHILHSMGEDECQRLLAKVHGALLTGGLVAVHDFILNDQAPGPLFAALFSLNMLLRTGRGRSYRQAEIGHMLRQAGFRDIRRLEFAGPNDSGIMVAFK